MCLLPLIIGRQSLTIALEDEPTLGQGIIEGRISILFSYVPRVSKEALDDSDDLANRHDYRAY